MKKCTSFEEQKGTKYIWGRFYFGLILFSYLSSTKLCLKFCLKEYSGQYSVLIKMHIATENEKFINVKFILKTIFWKMFRFYWSFFIDTIISLISSTQIACYVMFVQYVQKEPLEVFFKKDVLKNFANFTGKHPCWSLFFNKVTGLRASSFIRKRLQHRCVPVKLAKFYEHLFWRTVADDCWLNDV